MIFRQKRFFCELGSFFHCFLRFIINEEQKSSFSKLHIEGWKSYDGEIEQWDMIDKYSMNVIYTASVDIRRRMSAKKRSFDFVEFDTDLVGEQDIYPSEYVISDNSGHCCNVKNEWLYEAMLFLDDKLKEVLILKYWYLLSRRDIAKILNVSEKTITNWKNKAFKLIKNYKERRLECDIRGP